MSGAALIAILGLLVVAGVLQGALGMPEAGGARGRRASPWATGARKVLPLRRGGAGRWRGPAGGAGPGVRRAELAPARWATRRELRQLTVPGPVPGRLSLGTVAGLGRHRLVAAEAGASVLVVGPTQSGKTSGFAVPAIMEWEGPVVAASVKADLAHHTAGWRATRGAVFVYDPTATTGLERACWCPLARAATWPGARALARALTDVARSSAGALSDGDFWYATAAKLLAPLFLAAARAGATMADVVRWLDEQETAAVAATLSAAGEQQALRALEATWGRDERQRSAVYTTAETVVEVFADPAVAEVTRAVPGRPAIDLSSLLDGNHTLYVCAPAHDQRRLRPLFATLVSQVIAAAYERGARGAPGRPLLVVVDEAANVAPLAELDVVASTAAGHGVQLVTVWQDLAQVEARYGARAGTVVNNHRAKVFLPGIADTGTLRQVSELVGEGERGVSGVTVDARGRRTFSHNTVVSPLASPAALRRMAPGTALLLYGHLPPVRLRLRPWQEHRELARRGRTGASAADGGAS